MVYVLIVFDKFFIFTVFTRCSVQFIGKTLLAEEEEEAVKNVTSSKCKKAVLAVQLVLAQIALGVY